MLLFTIILSGCSHRCCVSRIEPPMERQVAREERRRDYLLLFYMYGRRVANLTRIRIHRKCRMI